MDKKDISIINALLNNSRLSFRQIAKKTKISVATVINRVSHLEKNKIIQRYTTDIDYEKIGYDVHAIIRLKISHGKVFQVEKKIAILPNVFAVYDTTGKYDSVIIAKFKNRRGLDTFLKKIQTYDFVEDTDTSLVLNVIKEKDINVS